MKGSLKRGRIFRWIMPVVALSAGLATLVAVLYRFLEIVPLPAGQPRVAGLAAEMCSPTDPGFAGGIRIEPVAQGLAKPVHAAHANDGSGRLFVAEKAGRIRIVKDGVLLPEPFLDIRDRVLSEDSGRTGDEQGLLGLAFHPGYAGNGRLFVNYTALEDGRTIVAEYRGGRDPNSVDRTSGRVILEIGQWCRAHNGGHLQFGPDGYLYIGVGDGACQRDGGGIAQNLGSLRGKVLRLDVDTGTPYGIPPGNPFVGREGVRPEIFAYGFRNPWRFSFDRCDGRLFLGDVGAEHWEEIDLISSGGNYGWPILEGTHCYPPNAVCDARGLVPPIAEYGHPGFDGDGGNGVVGGHVYRGRRLPQLAGHYLFADFFSTRVWSLTPSPSSPTAWMRRELLRLGFPVSSFGEGEDHELYLVGYHGAVYRMTSP